MRMSSRLVPEVLRVLSWNVAGRCNDNMIRLLVEDAPDLVLLQEVTEGVWPDYCAALSTYWKAFSLYLAPKPASLGRRYGLGVAVFGAPTTSCRLVHLPLPDLVQPERLLAVEVWPVGHAAPLTVLNYHALHGGHGAVKPQASAQVGQWLEEEQGTVLLGMDANSPDIDHPDFAETVCHWAQPPYTELEQQLLGPRKRHRLRDLFRDHLAQHPTEYGAVRRRAPAGPLAVSHYSRGRPRRYDHLWATPDVRSRRVSYDARGLARGNSDHAIVRAEVCLSPT